MPFSSPDASFCASTAFPVLIAARSLPPGARSFFASGATVGALAQPSSIESPATAIHLLIRFSSVVFYFARAGATRIPASPSREIASPTNPLAFSSSMKSYAYG